MSRRNAVLGALVVAAAAHGAWSQDAGVLVTVNGVPVRRAEVVDRAMSQHGNAVLNEMVDEILLRQEAQRLRVKADGKEVEARFARIQAQFPDAKTFRERLSATGSSVEAVRATLGEQVLREALLLKVKGLAATEAEVKELYEANKGRLGTPEAVRLRHILVATEKEANDFLVALKAGADFAELARGVSLDDATKPKGGDLGFIPRGMLQPEIEKLVFSLKPGETGGPVRTSVGYSLFEVEEARPPKPAAFKDVKEDLKKALLADKITKAWPAYIQELRQKAKYEGSKQRTAR